MNNRQISEEEIIAKLTRGGRIPLKCCFLFENEIYIWNPIHQNLGALVMLDDQLAQGCRQFLLSRSSVIERFEDVPIVARTQQWPNWELLQ